MKLCETCKWWDFGKAELYPDCHDCLNEKNGRSQCEDIDGFFAPHEASYHGWGFGIVPHAKFGCIHHEEK